jgi:hypothetical protein
MDRLKRDIPTLYASQLFHSGRQSPNSRPESKATAKATTNSLSQAHFVAGSHFGEEQQSFPHKTVFVVPEYQCPVKCGTRS